MTLVIFALALFASGCGTITHLSANPVQYNIVVPKAERGSLVNINTASAQELEKLPGVGKVIAERIVLHREQYGSFGRAEHLMMVRGISDRKFRGLHPLIVVE